MKRKIFKDKYGILYLHAPVCRIPFLKRLRMTNVTKTLPYWDLLTPLTSLEGSAFLESLYYARYNGEYLFIRGYGNKFNGTSFFIQENGDGRSKALERLAKAREARAHEDQIATLN